MSVCTKVKSENSFVDRERCGHLDVFCKDAVSGTRAKYAKTTFEVEKKKIDTSISMQY